MRSFGFCLAAAFAEAAAEGIAAARPPLRDGFDFRTVAAAEGVIPQAAIEDLHIRLGGSVG
eukprot:662392-Pyramimonas_sp.AAC.1